MATVIDSNFIMATCAVFTLMLMIFGGFFSFVVMPVINKNTEAINNLGQQFKDSIGEHKNILNVHDKRIQETEIGLAKVSVRVDDHIKVEE